MADHHDSHGESHAPAANDTPATFIWGIGASLSTGVIVYLMAYVLSGSYWPPEDYYLMDWFEQGLAISLAMFAAGAVFFSGKFTIDVGEKAYLMFIGVPIERFNLGPGDGWYVPLLMDIKIEDGRGQPVKPGRQSNSNKNGIEITSDVEGTFLTTDLMKRMANLSSAAAQQETVTAILVEAVRDSIAGESVDAFKQGGNMTFEEAKQLIENISTFKHRIRNNGSAIQAQVNEKLEQFGLKLTSLQIKDVDLPPEIEAAAKRIVSEAIEGGGLTKDAQNKVAVSNEFVNNYKTAMGEDAWNALSPERKSELIEGSQEMAMAIEGNATITSSRWRGKTPSGVITNT